MDQTICNLGAMVLMRQINYAWYMYRIWNIKRATQQLASLVAGAALAVGGCSTSGSSIISKRAVEQDGLAVGFVTTSGTAAQLKPYQRARYADRLASAILEINPSLTGQVDSYTYVSARVGKPFADIVKSYRTEGQLSQRVLRQLKTSQLRRRYLMLATILDIDKTYELPVEVTPLKGPSNPDLEDYQNVRFHTVRFKAVNVQVYDTYNGRRILDKIISSDQQDVMLASERTGRRYLGNSLLGAFANSVSNRVQGASDVDHPPAPSAEQALDYLWRQIAVQLRGINKS